MTKTAAYRLVACNLLLELTEDGNDMTWKEIEKEVDRQAKLNQAISKIRKDFPKDF